jgi:Bacterial archaeo-eukaryotic release factor family 10/eRF1 domain 3
MAVSAAKLQGASDPQAVLRRLADIEAPDSPVLSIYLDMRPQATGNSPGRRASLTVLRDRLSDIGATIGPRGPAFDSFQADSERLQAFLDRDFDRSAQGLAVFACSAIDLWETIEAGTPFEDSISADTRPHLFQLARLLDVFETSVVAVVDTNTVRLFVSRIGHLVELDGPDEDPVHHRKRSTGGWSQARYQRHIDKHHKDFATDAAAAIERLVERYDARRVVLGGDEVAITPLLSALSEPVKERVGEILRVDMRAPRDEVAAEVEPVLRRMEEEASASVADAVVAGVRSDGLGVAGLDATRKALDIGQVDTLVISDGAEIDDDARNDLVRLAATSGAEVQVVDDHEGLDRLGGIGGALRYRIEG